MASNQSLTPKGTRPLETRRSTKHKRASYGKELLAKALERRKKRPARAAKGFKGGVWVR